MAPDALWYDSEILSGVMKMEHEGEGNRYLHIIQLTNTSPYLRTAVPATVC